VIDREGPPQTRLAGEGTPVEDPLLAHPVQDSPSSISTVSPMASGAGLPAFWQRQMRTRGPFNVNTATVS